MKLRILCLHGYTQNGDVFRKRTAVLRKDWKSLAELVYVSAPLIAQDGEDEEKRAWFKANSDLSEYRHFDEGLDFLFQFWTEHGPFDGILGFSQGSTMAAMLCCMKQLELKPRFVILVSGRYPRDQTLINRLSKAHASPLAIPSLHIIGKNDEVVPSDHSEQLASLFENAQLAYHEGSHFVPSDAEFRRLFKEFLKKFLQEN